MAEISVPSIKTPRRRTRPYDNPQSELDTALQALTALAPPVGTLMPTLASVEPEGGAWKLCDGQLLSTSEYPSLFSVIGYTFGGSGTTFALPDMAGITPMGAGASYGPSLLALAGESEISVDITNLPAHSHTVTDPGHAHPFTADPHSHTVTDPGHDHQDQVNGSVSQATSAGTDNVVALFDATARTSSNTTGISISNGDVTGNTDTSTTGISVGNTGSGSPIQHIPPVIGTNWLVRV